MFVLDSHCDTPSQIYRLRDLSLDNAHGQVDIPKLQRGGVDGAFFALYTSNSLSQDASTRYALELLGCVQDTVAANSDKMAFALSPGQALENQSKGLFSVFLGLENGQPIGRSLSLLRAFYRAGVRYMTLTHAGNNEICDSCAAAVKRWHGLSPFGIEVVAEMNRLGMLIDVSHISDDSFWDVLKYSSKPVVASHSCCRALADHPRNLSDEMIRALADKGGVIQINFFPVFLDDAFSAVLNESGIMAWGEAVEDEFIKDPADEKKRDAWYEVEDKLAGLPRPSYKRIVDHIDHVVSLVGIDYVGLGSDFDGIAVTPEGLDNVSMMPKIFSEMRSRGYSEADIAKVASANFFRVFNEVLSL